MADFMENEAAFFLEKLKPRIDLRWSLHGMWE